MYFKSVHREIKELLFACKTAETQTYFVFDFTATGWDEFCMRDFLYATISFLDFFLI